MLRSFLLVSSAALLVSGCLTRGLQKTLTEIKVSDFVHHKFLDEIGYKPRKPPARYWDPQLEPVVYEFVRLAAQYGLVIPDETQHQLVEVKYVENLSMGNSPGVMAACNRYYAYEDTLGGQVKFRWMTIEVLRKESFDYTGGNPILIKEILFHELFHCFFNKGHLPPNYSGLMSPTFIKGSQRAIKDLPGLVRDALSPEYMSVTPDAS